MKILYLDCFAGISGDMMLGGLIDVGVEVEYLSKTLKQLNVSGYRIYTEDVKKNGITAKRFIVDVEEEGHPHRSFKDIKGIVETSKLSNKVKETSIGIFSILAEAEGKVHGVKPEDVVFHEVGAVDSIVDIVGVSVALERLDVERVYASSLPLGTGLVKSAHGIIPVPVPATVEILKGYPVRPSGIEAELTTPTGAAIVAYLSSGEMPPMEIAKVGYGAGNAKFKDLPNLLRTMLGSCPVKSGAGVDTEKLLVVECNIDDMNPMFYENLMERLFDEGALDVTLTPLYMKKLRPAVLLWTLCRVEVKNEIIRTIFLETTTIGLRTYEVFRYSLVRREEIFESPYGRVRIKISGERGKYLHVQPEYEDCKRIAREKGLPLKSVMETVAELYKKDN